MTLNLAWYRAGRDWEPITEIRARSRRYQMRKGLLFPIVFFIFLHSGGITVFAQPREAPRMAKEALRAAMDKPDVIIIDVRHDTDWTDSDLKIKGAVREDPDAIQSWANRYSKEKTIVLYCA